MLSYPCSPSSIIKPNSIVYIRLGELQCCETRGVDSLNWFRNNWRTENLWKKCRLQREQCYNRYDRQTLVMVERCGAWPVALSGQSNSQYCSGWCHSIHTYIGMYAVVMPWCERVSVQHADHTPVCRSVPHAINPTDWLEKFNEHNQHNKNNKHEFSEHTRLDSHLHIPINAIKR